MNEDRFERQAGAGRLATVLGLLILAEETARPWGDPPFPPGPLTHPRSRTSAERKVRNKKARKSRRKNRKRS